MNKRLCLFCLLLVLASSGVVAQQKDTLTKKLDSLSKKPDSVGAKEKINTTPASYNETTKVTPHVYMVLTLDDIKQQVTSPFRATNKDWLEIGAFGLLTT